MIEREYAYFRPTLKYYNLQIIFLKMYELIVLIIYTFYFLTSIYIYITKVYVL